LNRKYENEPKVFGEYHYPNKDGLIKSKKVYGNIIVARNPKHVLTKIDLYESPMERAMRITKQ
jgi:hypothetical protein